MYIIIAIVGIMYTMLRLKYNFYKNLYILFFFRIFAGFYRNWVCCKFTHHSIPR